MVRFEAGYYEPMRFKLFDDTRLTQLAAALLRLRGGRMSYMKLIKLMYIVDRISLLRTGHPISGDIYYSMKHGPVLSNALDLINTDPRLEAAPSYWHRHISAPDKYEIALQEDPGNGELSDFDESIIAEVFKEYGHLDRWSVVDLTHLFPEWEETNGSIRIPFENILQALGVAAARREKILAKIAVLEADDLLFQQ